MEEKKKKKRNWLWALILMLIVGGFAVFFVRSCDGRGVEVEVEEVDTVVVDTCGIALGEEVVDTLIGQEGTVEEVDSLGVEEETGDVAEEEIVVGGDREETEEEQSEQEKKKMAEKERQEKLRREAEERRKQAEAEARREAEAQEAEEAELRRQQDSLAAVEAARLAEEKVKNEGVLSGEFSVGGGKKVLFSQGNLQYQASTDTWRFAANQWDYEGLRNENIDPDNTGWIDLFGWGTSGYNKKYPFMISRQAAEYVTGERNIARTQYDWGVHNAISNGGGKANVWRTLTCNEWRYLFCKRKDASKLFTFATVAGVKGLVVLPDNWKTPAGAKLELSINKGMKYVGDDEYINSTPKTSMFDHNILSINSWRILEEAGAVFLPAAGGRDYANVFEDQVCGFYWSTTRVGTLEAYMIGFSAGNFVASDFELRCCGFSVRLVRDVIVQK